MFHKILRFFGILLAILVGLAAVAAVFIYFRSEAVVHETYTTPPLPYLDISTDPAVLARGEHLATTVSVCTTCHGKNFGGGVVVDDPALGRIVAFNLTKGQNGLGNELSDEDLIRVLRYGVKPDGTTVRVMPSDDYSHLSDEDTAALIAYLRSMPPVDSSLPVTEFRPLGRMLLALGKLDILIAKRIDFANAGSPAMTEAVTPEYGHYLANIAGCTGCHGPGLSGGSIPGAPPDWPQALNLTPGGEIAGWTEADFIQTIRTGITPSGRQLRSEMPWNEYQNMSDTELMALWAFIHSVPAKEFGNR
ncbi:MAG: c-type cytochrome [Anaerolineales bacterium]|nr:c-type cytochrome [Anaerolineales bacterium]